MKITAFDFIRFY